MGKSFIKIKNIYKKYNSDIILNDISLDFYLWKITWLIWPSWSWKTTLLKCISQLENQDKWEITINWNKYPSNNQSWIICPFLDIGIVFQNWYLWPHLTNKNNILASFNKPLSDDESNYLDLLVDILGVRDILNHYPNTSSWWQRQRIAIIRTLMKKPKFLLLDEPTASLDRLSIQMVSDLLLSLKNKWIGILLITHNISLVRKIADDFVFLEKGKVLEKWEVSNLLNPVSSELKEFLTS